MRNYFYRLLLSGVAISGLVMASSTQLVSNSIFPAAHAQKQYSIGDLSDWVKETGNKMVDVVNSGQSKKEKKEAFLSILNKYVDVNEIARFCLGRFWRVATPDQQKQYVELFHQTLINSITDRLGEYKGVSFQVGKASKVDGGNTSIQTTIIRPGQPNVNVQFVISTASGSPKIVDIIGENASLAVTQRGDYTSFIARHNNNVQSLIDALKRQIARHP